MTMKKETINVIAKDSYGEIIYVESFPNNDFKKVEDIGKYLQKKMKWPKSVICGYTRISQQRLLVQDAFSRNGKINWLLETEKVDIEKVALASPSNTVNVVVVCLKSPPGLGCALETALRVMGLKALFWLFLVIHSYLSPFRTLMKKYGVDEDFVKGTIKMRKEWDRGFISIDSFQCKGLVEYSIMRKLGYKLKDKKWATNIGRQPKFPDAIIRGE